MTESVRSRRRRLRSAGRASRPAAMQARAIPGFSITVVSVSVAGPSEVTGASVVVGLSDVVVSSSEAVPPHAVNIEPTATAAANA
ncbi:hypothetical protein ACNQR7_19960 [Mycolicibacterium senegalense]|uniref:hypothetical protein n=1 Tax=Mycolicibacterium senegalense TaxID=1796 RepID=UPI003AAAAC4E